MSSEAALKDRIIDYLADIGVVAWRNPTSLYGKSGRPDIEGVIPPRVMIGARYGIPFFIEAKKPGKYANPEKGLTTTQLAWVLKLRNAGALVLVVDSLDAVKAYFQKETK